MNEQQLITSCLKGDRLAQKKLYESYARKMMAVCFRYVNDKETAQDLLQEGFVKVFSSLSTYKGVGVFEGWLRRIFVNVSLEYIRKSDVMKWTTDIDEISYRSTDSETALETISAKELMDVIQRLPKGFRTVFNLYAIEGYSHGEIASMLDINESTSRSQYTRAKQLLQQQIKNWAK